MWVFCVDGSLLVFGPTAQGYAPRATPLPEALLKGITDAGNFWNFFNLNLRMNLFFLSAGTGDEFIVSIVGEIARRRAGKGAREVIMTQAFVRSFPPSVALRF